MRAIRRLLLPAVVLLSLVAAIAGAATAQPPPGLPAVALGATLVWRVEVAAAVFAVAYLAIVTVQLALHGRTFSRVGYAGVDIPEVGARSRTSGRRRISRARFALLVDAVTEIDARLCALEDPTDVLLRSDEGELA